MGKIKRTRTLVISAILMVVIAALGGWAFWYFSQPIVPDSVRKQLPFSPLVYVGSGYRASDYKFAAGEKVLSFFLKSKDKNTITVAEQTQPPQFTDIPEYKDKFLDSVTKRYATVQSSNITIYLTRPPRQEKQVGVVIDKGLLIFMTTDKDLSQDQWRKLADNLTIEKVD